jgi:hypothetical protein
VVGAVTIGSTTDYRLDAADDQLHLTLYHDLCVVAALV